jgi:predicted nucleotide-binding protein
MRRAVVDRAEETPISRAKLEVFLQSIPDLPKVSGSHKELIPYFGYFLTEELGQPQITSALLKACYDEAAIPSPSNVSDYINKSKAFVRTAEGTRLHRDAKRRIELSLLRQPYSQANPLEVEPAPSNGGRAADVVVIHGRDERVRESIFQLLRSVGLSPIEWNEAVHRTGSGSPYIGQILDAMFRDAQAIVAVFSPDERVELRRDLRSSPSDERAEWQPRPNVFVEAGMALAKDEAHTILVQVGTVRPASDLFGRHIPILDDSAERRNTFIQRLATAGCAVKLRGNDWLSSGKFKISQNVFKQDRSKPK